MTLTIDCVERDYDGYVLEFYAEKISSGNRLEKLQRPIPDLVLQAVSLIKAIHNDHPDRLLDSETSQFLFVRERKNRLVKPSSSYISKKLDFFADIIEIPTTISKGETHPRRWYLRPHELRRFFAYTFFWSSPDANLPTLCWFLGHLYPEDSERYVTNVISGSEAPDSLRQLVISGLDDDSTEGNVDALKKLIHKKFNGKAIELIPEVFLEQYISELIENNQVTAKIINAPAQHSGKAICIYIEDTKHDQSNN